MAGPYMIKLSFDPLLKPRLYGIQRSLACDKCNSWFNPQTYFMVNPQVLSTVQDVVQLVRSEHGIQTDIFFQAGGFHIPLGLPIEALRGIEKIIDVVPWGPTAPRVNFPRCNCGAATGGAQVGQTSPEVSGTQTGGHSMANMTGSSDGTYQFHQNTSVWSNNSELGPYTGNMAPWGNFS